MKRSRLITAAAIAGLAMCGSGSFAASRDWSVGTGMWGTGGNWTPTGTPGGLDIVSIGNMAAALNSTVTLNVNTTIAQLAITDGMTLDTQGFSLFNGTTTTLSGLNSTGTGNFATTLRIDQGAGTYSFRTNNLTVSNGARVDMFNGGELQVDNNFLLQANTQIGGNGVVNLFGNGATAMSVDGDIVAGIGGLTINQLGSGLIDLDGGAIGDHTISVTQANVGGQAASLTINGTGLADTFDEDLEIGGKNTLAMNLTNGWTQGGSSTLTFKANQFGQAGAAKLNGSTITFNGDIAFSGQAHGQINAPASVNTFSSVDVTQNSILEFNDDTTIYGGTWQLGKFARLQFDGPTHVKGGTFTTIDNNALNGDVEFNGATTYSGTVTFNGNAMQKGNVTVTDAAVINADVFNMSGSFPYPQYNISGGLTINADWLDVVNGSNGFDGSIVTTPNASNGAGSLTVHLPAGQTWNINNALALQGPAAGFVDAINGSPMALHGNTNVTGSVAITARTDFASGSTATINGSSVLAIDGGTMADPNTIHGGVITGAGTLLAQSGHALVGHGTITTSHVDFKGTAELRASGGTLAINGSAIENMGVLGTADATGVVDLKTSYASAPTSKIELLGGKIVGSALANGGLTTGFGTISNSFTNNKTLSAVGGELVLDGPTDLDGVLGGVPTVNAIFGDIRVVNSLSDSFAGVATVGGGRKLQLDNGWILESGGTLNVGGSLVQPATVSGGNLQAMFGRTNVSFGAVFDIQTGFLSGASVSLPNPSDQLSFSKNAIVNSGVTFTGNGSVRNINGSVFNVNPGGAVGVHVQNEGELNVAGNNNTGTITLKSLSSTATAKMSSEIGGATPGTQYDRTQITNGVSLDGKLALTTLNGYNPAYLTAHEIIHVGGNGVGGYFKSISGVQITPTKFWAVTYGASSVLATAARPGDTDLNGIIDFDDYSHADFGFNNTLPGWANGDFDGNGIVDFDDYSLMDLNFNTQSGSLMAAANWLSGDDRSEGNESLPGVQSVMHHAEMFGPQFTTAFLAAAVPEPTGALVACGFAVSAVCTRRRRSR